MRFDRNPRAAKAGARIALAACLALLVLAAFTPSASARERGVRSKIQHIVLVMMENRSFDHLLGWHPTADGVQEGLQYTDEAGNTRSTYALAPDYMGCGTSDPDHSFEGSRESYDGGRMDGFLRAGKNDEYAIAILRRGGPALHERARAATTRRPIASSASILGGDDTQPCFQHAAQTDRLSNTSDTSTLPYRSWDRLADGRGERAVLLHRTFPFLALWGTSTRTSPRSYGAVPRRRRRPGRSRGGLRRSAASSSRELGHVQQRPSALATVRAGDAFLSETFRAVASGPDWAARSSS
jgi:phospholipase C